MTDWNEALKTAEKGGLFLDDSKRKLQNSLQHSFGGDPAQAANISQISKDAGVSFELVERNKEQVEAAQKYNALDIDKILNDTPVTGEFLSNIDNAKQAHDDINTLMSVEQAIKSYKFGGASFDGVDYFPKIGSVDQPDQSPKIGAVQSTINAFKRGRLTDQAGIVGFEQLKSFDINRQRELKTLNSRIAALLPDDNGSFVNEWVDPAAEIVGQMLTAMADSVGVASASSAVAMTGAAVAGQAGPQIAIPEELVTIPAAGVMGFGYGAVTGMGIHAFKVESGHSYIEMLDITGENGEKINPEIARYGAMSVGLINAGLELTGLAAVSAPVKETIKRYTNNAVKKALKNPRTRDAVARFARNYSFAWAGEVTTEVLQEIVSIQATELAKDLSNGDFDSMTQEEWDGRITGIFEKVGKGMALLALPGASINFASEVSQIKQGKTDQQKLNNLSKASQESSLRKNNSEAFKELVRKMGENTDTSTVLINPEGAQVYFQGIPLEDAPQSIVDLTQELPKAIEEGRNLEVPVEIFATELAGTEFEAGLMPHMKLDPDALTPAEAQDKNIQAEIKALASMSEEKLSSEAEVYNDVLGQLLAIGQSEGTAKQYAILHEAFFRTIADRTGKDPLELYETYGLRVSRTVDPSLQERAKKIDAMDIILDRLRANDIPQDLDIFGKSITQFIAENGGIVDEGGELSTRDANTGKVGKNTLYRSTGRSLDDMAELLAESGYITERDEQQVLDAIDSELRGENVFALGKENGELQSVRQNLDQLSEIIDQAGLDINVLDNEAIKQALGGDQVQIGEEILNQPDLVALKRWQKLFNLLPHKNDDFTISMPVPNILSLMGFEGKGISVSKRVLTQIANKHRDIPVSVIERLPGYLDNPKYIYPHKDGGLNVVLNDVATEQGEPIIVGVRDGKIRTATPKNDTLNKTGQDIIGILVAESVLRGEKVFATNRKAIDESMALVAARTRTHPSISNNLNKNIVLGDEIVKQGEPSPEIINTPDKLFQKAKSNTSRGYFNRITNEITLTPKADLSTFIHESSHFFLEVMRDLSQQDSGLKSDLDVIDNWAKENGANSDRTIHESFASGFESYLMEGKAPTPEFKREHQSPPKQ